MIDARVLFAGTPEFARSSLLALLGAGIRPLAVWTQPDRPAGRGRKLAASPVKQLALAEGLPVYQPATLRDPAAHAELAAFRADLVVVAAYGLLFPQAVLDLPRLGCLNVHASLLPRWRGAAPIQAAIRAGDTETGISLMRMEAGLDSGPVYVREALAIGERETAGELHDRLAALGGRLLAACLPEIMTAVLTAMPQDHTRSSHAGKIGSADARIDWTRPAADIDRQVRAYNPVPGARFEFDGETIKCWQAMPVAATAAAAGTVLAAGQDGVDIATGDGALRLQAVQRPGKRRVSGAHFAQQLDRHGPATGRVAT